MKTMELKQVVDYIPIAMVVFGVLILFLLFATAKAIGHLEILTRRLDDAIDGVRVNVSDVNDTVNSISTELEYLSKDLDFVLGITHKKNCVEENEMFATVYARIAAEKASKTSQT